MNNTILDETIDGNKRKIQSRFGELEVNLSRIITFSNGILGYPNSKKFCLAKIPNYKKSEFKLLQNLEDEKLSFITYPIFNIDNKEQRQSSIPTYEQIDIDNLANDLNILKKDMLMLLISIFTQNETGPKVFINMRAPIIINVENQTGIQYVFKENKYLVRQEL